MEVNRSCTTNMDGENKRAQLAKWQNRWILNDAITILLICRGGRFPPIWTCRKKVTKTEAVQKRCCFVFIFSFHKKIANARLKRLRNLWELFASYVRSVFDFCSLQKTHEKLMCFNVFVRGTKRSKTKHTSFVICSNLGAKHNSKESKNDANIET